MFTQPTPAISPFEAVFRTSKHMLTDGAIGVRLMKEYNIAPDEHIAIAGALYNPDQATALKTLYRQYIDVAAAHSLPIMIGTPTRRSNPERIAASKHHHRKVIRDSVLFLKDIRAKHGSDHSPILIYGLMGCKGDAYRPVQILSIQDAFLFHAAQAHEFKDAGADCLFAGIMPALTEAVGMAQAMASTQLPYIISFMIRDNGMLLDGTPISEAIRVIDGSTCQKPLCYMANCVHPSILYRALASPKNSNTHEITRFAGIQANASPLTPEELDGSDEIAADAPEALAHSMSKLLEYPQMKIFGGCCGTDQRHMDATAKMLSQC